MKRLFTVLIATSFLSGNAMAQSIIVNADGTHSTMISHGTHSLIVNSNGTHSTGIKTGNVVTIINSDGTHSTAIVPGTPTLLVPNFSRNRQDRSLHLRQKLEADSLERNRLDSLRMEKRKLKKIRRTRSTVDISFGNAKK